MTYRASDDAGVPNRGAPAIPERFGRYEIRAVLGSGGMGTVHLAYDPMLHRQVAVKVPQLPEDADRRRREIDRILSEGRRAAGIRHPNVCAVHDAGEEGGLPFLVMEYIEGGTLADRLTAGRSVRRGQWDADQAVQLIRQIAAGVAEAHKLGLVHRDLKPGNILLTREGEPKVADFGLARPAADGHSAGDAATLVGTPAYMAPEQAGLEGLLGPQADVYALGCLLYKLLTGSEPFQGSLSEIHNDKKSGRFDPPTIHRPKLDPKLVDIVLRAMALRPVDRYANAAALGDALTDWSRRRARRRLISLLTKAAMVAIPVVLIALVGSIGGVIFFAKPSVQPIGLGIPVAEYADPAYPPNPWAQRGGEALRGYFGADGALARQLQENGSLLDQISSLEARTSKDNRGRPVVLYLNAFAVGHSGKVHVLLGRAKPDSPASWLQLDDVLSALRRCPSPRLLLLDLAHPIADAHSGILANNLADLLHDELSRAEEAGNLPFLVLTSCGQGQISHVSLELQRSLFGFFLEQGMAGYADGWNDENRKNDQVTALELAKYTAVQVATWAEQHRLAPQVPQLYGKGKDFRLISPKTPYPEMKLPEPFPDYWKWLADAWMERDRWRANGIFRRMPRTFRELEVVLQRAERRWLAGDAEDIVKGEFDSKFADLRKQHQQLKEFAPLSLAQARRQGWQEDPAFVNKVVMLLDKIQSGIPLKPEDMKPIQEKPPEPGQLPVLAHYTLEAMLRLPDPTAEQLKEFDAFLKNFALPRYVELEALRFLLAIDEVKGMREKWQDLVGVRFRLLNAARAAEQAVAIDPRVSPWVKTDLAEADKLRREGLLQMATGGLDDRSAGFKKLQDSVQIYEETKKTAQAIETGFQQLEEVRSLLPALVAHLSNGVPDWIDEQLWKRLVESTATLQRFLTPSRDPGKLALNQFIPVTQRLKSDLALLRKPYDSDDLKRRLRRAGQPNGPTADDLLRLLESPMWNSGDRLLIYATARELGRTVSAAALQHAANLALGTALTAGDARIPDTPARRAKPAIDLLSLDGFTNVDPLNESLGRAEKANTAEAWQTLAAELRKAWAVTLPQRYKESTDLAAREQAGVFIHPLDIGSANDADQRFPGEPAADLRRRQSRDFWQWLAVERYLKDAEALGSKKERTDLANYAKALEEIGIGLRVRVP